MAKANKAAKKSTDQVQAENTAKFLAESKNATNKDGSVGTDLAAKTAADDAVKATKAAERLAANAVKKAEREARLEALKTEGRNYVGSMLALADRVKSGAYVKGLTGQLRSNDELAVALDGVGPNGVIQLAKHVLATEENPYTKLNIGQQSMNFRNRMRGAIKKGTLTIDAVKAAVVELDLDASEAIMKAAADKVARVAARKAEAEAKKADKPVKAEVEQEEKAEATA